PLLAEEPGPASGALSPAARALQGTGPSALLSTQTREDDRLPRCRAGLRADAAPAVDGRRRQELRVWARSGEDAELGPSPAISGCRCVRHASRGVFSVPVLTGNQGSAPTAA